MLKSKTIVVLSCWYGKYPWYFKYFIHSCTHNPTVDFIIITDNGQSIYKQPDNVKIVHKTLEGIKSVACEKLGFNVNMDYPYKLCDFRPAFGFLFPEIIKEYDFWGHADIDLIFGNIRNFITSKILQVHDVISVRHEYVAGFFSLYRNTDKINTLFKRSIDYITIFQSDKYLGFDECGLLCNYLIEGANIFEISSDIESITHVVKKMHKEGIIKVYLDLHVIEGTPGELEWENGALIYKNMYEILLYHLIIFKTHPKLVIPKWKKIPATYFINEFSFSKR